LEAPVPTANPKQLTDARKSVDSAVDERSLQVDKVKFQASFAADVGDDKAAFMADSQCRGA
jgi:hypothetical protein